MLKYIVNISPHEHYCSLFFTLTNEIVNLERPLTRMEAIQKVKEMDIPKDADPKEYKQYMTEKLLKEKTKKFTSLYDAISTAIRFLEKKGVLQISAEEISFRYDDSEQQFEKELDEKTRNYMEVYGIYKEQ